MKKLFESFMFAVLASLCIVMLILLCVLIAQKFGASSLLYGFIFLIVWRITHSAMNEF